MDIAGEFSPLNSTGGTATPPPELIESSMEFLSRSWSPSAFRIAKALSPRLTALRAASAHKDTSKAAGNSLTFASSATSQLVLERIMSHSQEEVSQLTSGRLSHSSGPLNGGSLSDSPSFSFSDWEEVEDLPFLAHSFHSEENKFLQQHHRTTKPPKPIYRAESRTLSKWLKNRRDQKEETHAHNAQLHAAVSIAGLAAAVSSIAAAASAEDYRAARTNLAISSAATLVAAQCVEAAEALGAERGRLAAAVASAVSVRRPGDILTLTASAAAALRGAAALKARVFKEMWNLAAVIPVEKGFSGNGSCHSDLSGEFMDEENFVGLCSQELLARGGELLKRSRTGALHWKIVSVYIDRNGRVKLKTKSRHVAGNITNKKKNVIEVWKDIPAWPGRQGEALERRYFGLKTKEERVIEFECRGEREYEMWTKGVSRLLSIVGEKARRVSRSVI